VGEARRAGDGEGWDAEVKIKMKPRIKFVIVFNLLATLYYFRFFLKTLSREWDLQTPLYFLSSLGLLVGAVFLFRGRNFGKTLTKWVGVLGIITITGIAVWGFSYFGDPRYSFDSNVKNLIANTLGYSIRHAYPIIAGFIVLNKSKEELGLH